MINKKPFEKSYERRRKTIAISTIIYDIAVGLVFACVFVLVSFLSVFALYAISHSCTTPFSFLEVVVVMVGYCISVCLLTGAFYIIVTLSSMCDTMEQIHNDLHYAFRHQILANARAQQKEREGKGV
jgi:Cu/Ag efflux pump CusA